MLNEDYKDMLRALSDEKVKFLLVGACGLAALADAEAMEALKTSENSPPEKKYLAWGTICSE